VLHILVPTFITTASKKAKEVKQNVSDDYSHVDVDRLVDTFANIHTPTTVASGSSGDHSAHSSPEFPRKLEIEQKLQESSTHLRLLGQINDMKNEIMKEKRDNALKLEEKNLKIKGMQESNEKAEAKVTDLEEEVKFWKEKHNNVLEEKMSIQKQLELEQEKHHSSSNTMKKMWLDERNVLVEKIDDLQDQLTAINNAISSAPPSPIKPAPTPDHFASAVSSPLPKKGGKLSVGTNKTSQLSKKEVVADLVKDEDFISELKAELKANIEKPSIESITKIATSQEPDVVSASYLVIFRQQEIQIEELEQAIDEKNGIIADLNAQIIVKDKQIEISRGNLHKMKDETTMLKGQIKELIKDVHTVASMVKSTSRASKENLKSER
jgi:chromosome segregation ATPase